MPQQHRTSVSALFRWLRTATSSLLVTIVTILSIDIIAFQLMPRHLNGLFPGYRTTLVVQPLPKGYHQPHAERGFDIAPNQRGTYFYRDKGIRLPVWSNELGCFDENMPAALGDFVYLAGDSFTWGVYSPYEAKFGTVFESVTGVTTLQCGVVGTGQRHQFSKFLEISQKLARWPTKVLVFYYANDVDDDYLFPAQTVVDGWLVDSKAVDGEGQIVELEHAWLRARVAQRVEEVSKLERRHWVIRTLRYYSATAQLLKYIALSMVPRSSPIETSSSDEKEVIQLSSRYFGVADYLHYRDSDRADANMRVIKAWNEHARKMKYSLTFVLIEPMTRVGTDYFRELKPYLHTVGIEYYDLTQELKRRGHNPVEIYRVGEGHFSDEGNITVGKMLADIVCEAAPVRTACRSGTGRASGR